VSVLAPKSYDGTDINPLDAPDFRARFPRDGTALVPARQQQRVVRVAGFWPTALDPQPQERQLALVVILPSPSDDALQDLAALFAPSKGERTLVVTDGTLDWQMNCSVVAIDHVAGLLNVFRVTLQASYGLWKRIDDSIVTASISAATTASLSAPSTGNERSPLILEVTPTAVKGTGNDQRYRRETVVAWRAARGAVRYPLAIQLDTATEVTATRMQADGDDLRVLVDGREVDRWLGNPNAATTNVWIVLDFAPAASAALKAAITDVAPATGGTLAFVDASTLPPSGVLLVGTEAIAWSGKSADGNTLTGITRGVRATTAASHSAGDTAYLVEHQIDLVYGYTAATAPVTDDRDKPVIALTTADSSNAQWTYDAAFATAAGGRPGEWVPTMLGTNLGMVALRGSAGAEATYVPTGVGSTASGTVAAHGAATLWQCLDDTPGSPDDDTTYVSMDGDSGTKVSADIATPATPDAGASITVRVLLRYRQTVRAGSPAVRAHLRIGGTNYLSAATVPITSTGYGSVYFTFDTDPTTSLAWTPSGVAAIQEIGFDLVGTSSTEIRLTAMFLSVLTTAESDPATEIGIFYAAGGELQGHDPADAWVLGTPCGVNGNTAIDATAILGSNITTAGLERMIGVDETGRTISIYLSPTNGSTSIVVTPQGPLYVVGIWTPYSGTAAGSGFSISDIVLVFDTTQTPVVVVGARADTFIHRWTLTSPVTGQALTMLFPSALNKKLTIDADTGAVSYADAGYNPLPGMSLDAPRLAWLEVAAGANALAWADATNGSGALTFVARYRDRRS
jgi:hypothetical protein